MFTQLVLVLAEKGFITLDVEYIDGTKMESKANKYTFVWRKTAERNSARLREKIRVLLEQIDESIAQGNAAIVANVGYRIVSDIDESARDPVGGSTTLDSESNVLGIGANAQQKGDCKSE